MRHGLAQLGQEGLEFGHEEAERMARFMFTMLDLKELSHAA